MNLTKSTSAYKGPLLEALIKKLEDALKNDNIEIIKEVFHNKYIDLKDV